MTAVPGYVLDWAALPGPARTLAAARDRLERGRLGSRSELSVHLTSEERAQVGRLLPPAWVVSGSPVRTRDLRQGLRDNGVTLEQLLVVGGGPLRDLRAEREQDSADRRRDQSTGLGRLSALLGQTGAQPPEPTVEKVLRRCLASAPSWAGRADEIGGVVERLPADGESEALAVLAARIRGDAHALDQSGALGRAVCRFLSLRAALAPQLDADPAETVLLEWADPVRSAETWRAAWASAGVACDALSSQVLVLNLPLQGTATGVALASVAPGEPVWLTLRSLTGGEVALARGVTDVFVCENPSVVEAAADRLGAASRPLVCTFGRPGVAAWRLLEVVARSARVWVRADGDVAGWGIVAALESRIAGARRWRMPPGTTAYEEELVADLLSDLDARTGEPDGGRTVASVGRSAVGQPRRSVGVPRPAT